MVSQVWTFLAGSVLSVIFEAIVIESEMPWIFSDWCCCPMPALGVERSYESLAHWLRRELLPVWVYSLPSSSMLGNPNF